MKSSRTGGAARPSGHRPLSITAESISRTFQTHREAVRAVHHADLRIEPGEFVCILGASGSGKTTLINIIAGITVPDEGRLLVGSTDVGRLDEPGRTRLRLTTIGVVFQDHNLIEEFTAAENVALPLEVGGTATADALTEAEVQLDAVGLAGLSRRFPRELSGGQRQRVGVARALAGGRSVIVADEPTGSLDSKNSDHLFALFAMISSRGATVVVATHDQSCSTFADRTYVMVDGRLEAPAFTDRSR